MGAAAREPPMWTRHDDQLSCRVEVSAVWEGLARNFALHRLRQIRALPYGFLHPIDIALDAGQLRLRFEHGALRAQARRPRSFAGWRDQQLLPLVETLLLCHDRGVAGLSASAIIGGRWVPPVEWFLPRHRSGVTHADFCAAAAWIEAEARAGRGAPHRLAFLDALQTADVPRLRSLVQTGRPDRVCTMFGSTCGSGFHNIIYMQREVYPCGRMFGQRRWVLGRFDEPLDVFPQRMAAMVGERGCGAEHAAQDNGPAGADCLIERESSGYDPSPRSSFVSWFALMRTAARSSTA